MTIKEYWNLIGREPFLAITWELDFCHACSFRRMLMNHKNFHFTQISDKINDVIFWKSSKTMFSGHFCPMGTLSKKSGSVTYNYIWAPNTMLSFMKKISRSREKLTDRRKDGKTLFNRTLPGEPGGPIRCLIFISRDGEGVGRKTFQSFNILHHWFMHLKWQWLG